MGGNAGRLGREIVAADGGTTPVTAGLAGSGETPGWTGVEEVATGGPAGRIGREKDFAEGRTSQVTLGTGPTRLTAGRAERGASGGRNRSSSGMAGREAGSAGPARGGLDGTRVAMGAVAEKERGSSSPSASPASAASSASISASKLADSALSHPSRSDQDLDSRTSINSEPVGEMGEDGWVRRWRCSCGGGVRGWLDSTGVGLAMPSTSTAAMSSEHLCGFGLGGVSPGAFKVGMVL